MCNRLAIDRPCPASQQLCRLDKMFNIRTRQNQKSEQEKEENILFQNGAQDEHHKCHAGGEI